jgi:outer membrane protein OmpA-like peptidoglycan-associated protein
MMKKHLNILLVASSTLALVACTAENSVRFNQEAGAFIDEGGFGNPTMNNSLLMTGQKSYVVNLNRRFAQEVDTSVNFAFDSAVLDGAARATLAEQANWIRQFPEVRFKVYGHTDLVGSEAYNKSLGLRRARAAVNFLVSQGISRSRLEAVVSFGETQPLVATQDEEVRNRRTVTEVTGFVKNHPAVLNGKYAAIIFRDYVAEGAVQEPGGGALAEGN